MGVFNTVYGVATIDDPAGYFWPLVNVFVGGASLAVTPFMWLYDDRHAAAKETMELLKTLLESTRELWKAETQRRAEQPIRQLLEVKRDG